MLTIFYKNLLLFGYKQLFTNSKNSKQGSNCQYFEIIIVNIQYQKEFL